MHYDDHALFRKLGITVVHGIGIEDVVTAADAIEPDAVQEECRNLQDRFSAVEVGDRKIEDSVRMFLAMKRICREKGLDAAAFSCWPRLQELKNMKPCVSNAMLDSINIPSACEGDMLSAVSMLILQTLSSKPAAVMDLPAFDIEDDSLLLWHCGSAPFDMADSTGVRCRYHYRAAFDDKTGDDQDGPVTDMVFAPGPVTVFRLTDGAGRFYYFTGELFKTDKASWDGSRGWVRDLRMYGDPISSIDMMNTILTGGLQHHFPLVLKDVSGELEEFAAWIGLSRVPRIPYADFLRTD
jgi:L-fucose isomerase-like protein